MASFHTVLFDRSRFDLTNLDFEILRLELGDYRIHTEIYLPVLAYTLTCSGRDQPLFKTSQMVEPFSQSA